MRRLISEVRAPFHYYYTTIKQLYLTKPTNHSMKLTLPLLATGMAFGLALSSAPAALMDKLQGYYTFESQTNGTTPNMARALGYPAFPLDWATLLKPVPVVGSVAFPPWTNLASKVLAGTGVLDCREDGDFATTSDLPIWDQQADWTISTWFKPDTGGTGLFGTTTRMFILETAGATAPISFGIRGTTSTNADGVGLCDFQFYSWYADGTKPYVDYLVPTNQVDQWHHVAIQYDSQDTSWGTNTHGMMRGYVDDALVCQLAPTDIFIGYTGFNFGTYRGADGRWLHGQIDEAAMWERVLNTNEITLLYNAGVSQQTLAAAIATGGDAAQLTNTLVAYWNFDGNYGTNTSRVVPNQAIAVGGRAIFPSGSGDLTMVGGTYAPGTIITYPGLGTNGSIVGLGSLLCNGTNVYVNIPGNPVDPQQDLTVSAWFKPDTGGTGLFGVTSARYFVFENSDPTKTWAPISFGIRGGTVLDTNGNQTCTFEWYGHWSDNTKPHFDSYVPVARVDQWHHVAQIFRLISVNPYTNAMECWLDGVLQTNLLMVKTNAALTNISGLNFGTYRGADSRWFKGQIDECALWQRALSSNEVVQLYTNGLAGKSVLTPAPPQIIALTPAAVPAGSYLLSWKALAGLKYSVFASSDLTSWQPALVTGYTTASGTATIIVSATEPPPNGGYYDPGLNGATQRYYRLQVQP